MSSLNVVSQKEYLKKYLGIGKAPGEKKKKKKKDKDSANRLKIIDDDIDDYNMSKEIQMDIEAADEDAPQIVSVIDDRPPSLRVDEKTNTLLWKPLGEDSDVKPDIPKKMGSFQLKKSTLENKSYLLSSKKMTKDILKQKGEKAYNSGSHHIEGGSSSVKDLEREIKKERSVPLINETGNCNGKDRYQSPEKCRSSQKHDLSQSHKRNSSDSDSDISPVKGHVQKTHSRDGGGHPHSRKESRDLSPIRIIKQEPTDENDYSPPRRKGSLDTPNERNLEANHSRRIKQELDDLSPSRRKGYNSKNILPMKEWIPSKDSDDISPPRRQQCNSESGDISPRRRTQKYNSSEDISPPRKGRRNSNGSDDISPPRRKKKDSSSNLDREISLPRKRQDRSYKYCDGDISPPRKKNSGSQGEAIISPPRRKRSEEHDFRRVKDDSQSRKKRRSNENVSSPRKFNRVGSNSPDRKKKDRQTHSRWGDWGTNHEAKNYGKPEKTMSGKRAGLQSAKELSKEIATMKEKEDQVFQNMSEEVSGRNAATIVRGQKTKDPEEEMQKLKKEQEMKEKYDRWGKGLKQVESDNQRMADQLYEMSKPLARYADDEDLEKYLKEQEREGDPMLNYIRKKKKKKKVDAGIPEKPMYMGEFMPNRYGIRPGYRWDGVDRSNGYEKRWFEQFNAKKAVQEEAFKWSTEDM